MRKILSLVLALALVCSLCAMTMATGEGETTTLTVIQKYGTDDRNALLQQLVNDGGFDYTLEFVDTTASDLNERIMMRQASNQKLDILFDVNVLESGLIRNGSVQDLTDFVATWEDYEKIDKGLMNIATAWDGHPYAIPVEKYQRILFYRSDWLEEAGYDHPPKTWQELYDMSLDIQERFPGRYGYSFRGGQGIASMFEMTVLGHYDPAVINLTRPYITDEGYAIMDEYYKDQFIAALEEYKWQYDNIAPADSITWGYPEMVEGFYSGVTCFLIQTAEVIETCSKYMEEGTWDTAMLPVSENGCAWSPVSAGSVSVSSTAENMDAAYDFIRAVCGYDGAKAYATFYGTTPMYDYAEGFGNHYYDAYGEMVANADTQIAYAGTYIEMTEEERELQSEVGFNTDLTLQQYVSGQIDAETFRSEYYEAYAWTEDSEWIAALREGNAE